MTALKIHLKLMIVICALTNRIIYVNAFFICASFYIVLVNIILVIDQSVFQVNKKMALLIITLLAASVLGFLMYKIYVGATTLPEGAYYITDEAALPKQE